MGRGRPIAQPLQAGPDRRGGVDRRHVPSVAATDRKTVGRGAGRQRLRTFAPVNRKGRPANRLVDQSTNRPIDQSTNRPIDQSTNRPIDRSTNRPIDQSTDRPIDRSTNRPIDQQTTQSIDHPTGRLVYDTNLTVGGLDEESS